jgi:hypothetical protein
MGARSGITWVAWEMAAEEMRRTSPSQKIKANSTSTS